MYGAPAIAEALPVPGPHDPSLSLYGSAGKPSTASTPPDIRKTSVFSEVGDPWDQKKAVNPVLARFTACCSWSAGRSGADEIEGIEVAVSIRAHQVVVVRDDRVHLLIRVSEMPAEDLVVDVPVVGPVGNVATVRCLSLIHI